MAHDGRGIDPAKLLNQIQELRDEVAVMRTRAEAAEAALAHASADPTSRVKHALTLRRLALRAVAAVVAHHATRAHQAGALDANARLEALGKEVIAMAEVAT